MILIKVAVFAALWRFSLSQNEQRNPGVRPPSFKRTPTLIECRDGSSRPLVNASTSDYALLRSIHPHCPSSVLQFRQTLPHCPDIVSFCPREFWAISPCGDCCLVCRVPNEDFMAETAAANGKNGPSPQQSNDNVASSSSKVAGPCHNIKCKRHQKCVLNIQGLPVCRCFPVQMCATSQASIGLPVAMGGKKRKDKRLEKVCGNDGVTYETKCHMQVAACQANLHTRIAHKGACIKPAARETSQREEPSIRVKPSRGNRKPNRQTHNNINDGRGSNNNKDRQHNLHHSQRAYSATPAPTIRTAVTVGRVIPPHQPPALIVPIISPSEASTSSLVHRGGNGNSRKHQGTGWSRTSAAGASTSTMNGRDRNGAKNRKAERRREKIASRGERQRNGERNRAAGGGGGAVERPAAGRMKTERTERQKQHQQQRQNERADRARPERPDRTRNNGDRIKFKATRGDRPTRIDRGRAEKPKATKKIQRLERKKHKLEQRLIKEKKKVERRKGAS